MYQYKRTITASLIFIILIFLGLVLLWRFPGVADAFSGDELSEVQNIYLDLGGSSLKTKLSLGKSVDNGQYMLVVSPFFKNQQRIVLNSFEHNIRLEKHIEMSKKDYLIFSGDVGAHSQNLVVLELVEHQIRYIQIEQSGMLEPSLVSDWPRFEIMQYENSLDIAVYNRDYDKDPLVDYRKLVYETRDNIFILKTETTGQ